MVTFVTTVIAVAFLIGGNVVAFATIVIVEVFPIGGNVVTFAFSGNKAGCFISEDRVTFSINGISWI